MRSGAFKAVAVVAAVSGGIAAGYLYRGRALAAPAEAAPPAAMAATAPATPVAALPDFSGIVQRYGPAVVNVSTTATASAVVTPFGPLDPDDPFFQFFKHFRIPNQGHSVTRGIGSGFVVKPDGVILTNAHVVEGATEVRVKLTDRRELPARVVGIDKTTDVAVLKVDARDLPTVRVGDPTQVRVGEWVLAIGSPFGFENSATAGIVSARGRALPDEGYVPFIQTDVAVNPGNSGGPLFDTSGQVIGINSQIYTRSGGYMGVSFAIPIDVAMRVENQILAHGKVVRGRLGVTVQDVNQSLAESFGLPKPEGALVSQVERGGAAAGAGLEPGDVILALNGKPIATSSELPPLVADTAPGTRVTLQVWRDRQRRDVEVKVGQMKDEVASGTEKVAGQHGRLGLEVRPLTPEERRQADVSGGLLVNGVSGPAERAGLRPGDVVLALDGTPVKDVGQLRGLLAKAGKHVALLVERDKARIFVPVDLG